MSFDPQALVLNEIIGAENPALFHCLSQRGKAAFFPKQGILSQTAEAKQCRINATIGVAFDDDNTVLCLESINEHLHGLGKTVFNYAPSPGLETLRHAWKSQMIQKNPSLAQVPTTLPMVTTALTHGLFCAGLLFVNPSDTILIGAPYWENYSLIFEKMCGAIINTFPLFTPSGHFHAEGLAQQLRQQSGRKKIILLNFPNNPTGYTPTHAEAADLIAAIVESANNGSEIVVLVDDAYFGLFYENDILSESLFCSLSQRHPLVCVVKIDGPTKEDYVWGFRVGFITIAASPHNTPLYQALEQKLAGIIRATISNSSHLSQALLLQAYSSSQIHVQRNAHHDLLQKRYLTVKAILHSHPEYHSVFSPMPFNSGYFMCIAINPLIDAEGLRRMLITDYSCGTIVLGQLMRIAFSSTPTQDLQQLFDTIYSAGKRFLT
ncbi:MAG: aminotransferase class I/II-fold pyridoxal phosphate-dependent enzyme [Chitinivibrionales bacterium]|nr:aminotransferase class I/II-fold pyridoxal phosphate-dependent enzyme [Chitinivibrionales bacterium]